MSEQKKQQQPPAPVVVTPPPKSEAALSGEMEPKSVRLERPREKDGKLSDVAPAAPTAGNGPVPRLVDGNERAPKGLRRYVVHCNEPFAPKRYVLARDAGEAEAHYRKYASLDKQAVVVKELAD